MNSWIFGVMASFFGIGLYFVCGDGVKRGRLDPGIPWKVLAVSEFCIGVCLLVGRLPWKATDFLAYSLLAISVMGLMYFCYAVLRNGARQRARARIGRDS